jgi:peptidoglycan/xylan/chitin deacetylase (PgdA/CDA1 family)
MIKGIIKSVIASLPAWSLLHRLRHPALTVLTYHRINRDSVSMFSGLHVDIFREQMRWLRRRCRVVTADEALGAVARPERGRPQVLVTFDDGYRDYHDIAFPILEELKIPALMFVPTAFTSQARLIWTDAIACAVQTSAVPYIVLPWSRDRRLCLEGPTQRADVLRRAKDHLKRLSDLERRSCLEELLHALDIPRPEAAVERQMMTWEEIRATQPLTSYGGHSHGHAILSSMEHAALREDLATCTTMLREHAAVEPKYFAYPNGTANDFDAFTQECLRELGYKAAFTTIPGRNRPGCDYMALRRQPTTGRNSVDFAWLTAGLGT